MAKEKKSQETLELAAGPVASQAIEAIAKGSAREIGIYGPRGESKTISGAMATILHAKHHSAAGFPLPVPWAVVGDSFNSHKEKTIPSLSHPLWKGGWRMYDDNHKAIFRVDRREAVILDLIGIEDSGAIDRVRLETCGLWVEEPAPATTGQGVPELAYLTAITSQRIPTHAKVAFWTSNYPEEEHWTWERMSPGPGTSGRHPDNPSRMWFRIPKGDNPYISDADRAEWAAALASRPDLAARLLEGQPGIIRLGPQVAEGFREDKHVSPTRLRPQSGEPLIIGQDFGHTPATIIGQLWRGFTRVFAALPCERGGVKQHLEQSVIPWMQSNAPWALRDRALVVGGYDPAGNTGEETDINQSPLRVLEEMLQGYWTKGPIAWEARKGLLLWSLLSTVDFGAGLQIDPVGGRPLIQALSGRWHYSEDRFGNVSRDLPKKPNHPWEDLGDAFIYFLSAVTPSQIKHEPLKVESGFNVFQDDPLSVISDFQP